MAHGAELLLKFRLLEQGDSQAAVAKKFGHNLAKLWAAEANAEVRQLVLDCAETAWQMARGSAVSTQTMTSRTTRDVCLQRPSRNFLCSMAAKRISPSGILTSTTKAPRPAFLIDAFGDAAEQLVDQAPGEGESAVIYGR